MGKLIAAGDPFVVEAAERNGLADGLDAGPALGLVELLFEDLPAFQKPSHTGAKGLKFDHGGHAIGAKHALEFHESESLIGDPVDFGITDLIVDGGEFDQVDAIESALGERELFDKCFLAGALGLKGLPPVIGFGADFVGVLTGMEEDFRGHAVFEGIGAGFQPALN